MQEGNEMTKIEGRKADHINICLEQKVSPDYRYWDDVKLIHEALPEVDYDDIDTSAYVLGKKLEFPFIVTAITGGFEGAKKINANIAEACAELGVGMGVGSERAAIEGVDKESYSIIKDYDVPLVIGNVGAPQLIDQKGKKGFTSEDIALAKDIIDADYMAVHLNYLQEAVQPEGDMRASGCFDAIRSLAREFPLIVKETGAGMSPKTIARLSTIGIEAIDIGGAGGTSFSAIEMYRAGEANNGLKQELGYTFFDWGNPRSRIIDGGGDGHPPHRVRRYPDRTGCRQVHRIGCNGGRRSVCHTARSSRIRRGGEKRPEADARGVQDGDDAHRIKEC